MSFSFPGFFSRFKWPLLGVLIALMVGGWVATRDGKGQTRFSTATVNRVKDALPGLHAEPAHRECGKCHQGAHDAGPFSSRATCISCHQKQRDHVPEAQLCQGCHVFAR